MNTGSEKQRDRDEKVVEIEIERLHDFKNHPFKVQTDSQMKELQDSISKYGILNPLIVRPRPEGFYKVISGYRRKYSAMELKYTKLSRRLSMQDEAEQKAKIDREQANELEYVDESQKADSTATASGSSGNAGGKPVRNPEREKPKWEDTITNRMLHWSYTPEQKEELKMALAAGIPRATILTYFYPEVTVEKMSSYRKKQ